MPAVSVIMPVYNVQDYIVKAVNSVLNQTFRDFELIVINDGTRDDSMDYVVEKASADKRMKIINKENGGLSSARNAGLRAAQGDYVCFIDSDDVVDSALLETTMKRINRNKPDVLMFGMVLERTTCNEEIKGSVHLTLPGSEHSRQTFKDFIISEDSLKLIGYSTNKLYRRTMLEKYTILFDDKIKLLEDINFNEKVFKAAESLLIIEDCLYHYKLRKRQSLMNIFQKQYFDYEMEAIRCRKEILEKWGVEQVKIDTAIAHLHMLAIRGSCSNLFSKQNNLSFKEKCGYINLMLQHPLTEERIKCFTSLCVVDRILHVLIERKKIYTIAFISSVYAFHLKRFN